MLGANGPRGARPPPPGNGTGVTQLQSAVVQQANVVGLSAAAGGVVPVRFDHDRDPLCSGSDNDSDSVDEEDQMGSLADSRRGVKRERGDMETVVVGQEVGGVRRGKAWEKDGGRVKIKMEFIDNKLRRYTTFSKRKTAYELSTLTGTQVLLLVASETGHVYTFATRKLQPMITSETGKALIQTCLNSPDSMSATGFEETDLTYQVSEAEGLGETKVKTLTENTSIMLGTSSH
uniref:Serum response factor n=1 Tax=Neogobius melanostomus TaxID=47308 RepID=A0A8C6TSD0_9GOBI